VLESNTHEVTTSAETTVDEQKPAATAEPEATVDPQDVGGLYVEYRMLLLSVACRKFRVPETDAENLIQDVFLSYLQAGTKVENIRSWLVAAMCKASRHYYSATGRRESLPEDYNERSDPDSDAVAEKLAREITLRQALGYLQPRCRETLHLHYFEGRSAGDMAREMSTTNRYAEKLIHNCLKRVREIYRSINAVSKK